MALPHIKNSQAGVNRYDPVHKSIFEVYFTLPEALRTDFAKDELVLTEHVMKIEGLDALYRAPETGTQKFMGTDRSFINPTIGETRANLKVTFTLNLRNATDNYILKLFRAWAALGYDIATGKRTIKNNYCADWLRVAVANRDGDIYQEIIFKDIMIHGNLETDGDLDYENNDALQLVVNFVSDWWEEKVA